MSRHQFMWLDLETTGIDPYRCRILEWAVVLAADDRDGDMQPVAQYSSAVAIEALSDLPELEDNVRKMHTDSGLLDECRASTTTLGESEGFLVALAQELTGAPEPRGIVLAGSGVRFDLGFLRVHLPRFARCLSHRVFDVRTLQMAESAWGRGGAPPVVTSVAHRALPDVLEALAIARAWRTSWCAP